MSDHNSSADVLRRLRANPAVVIAGFLVLVAAFALCIDLPVGP